LLQQGATADVKNEQGETGLSIDISYDRSNSVRNPIRITNRLLEYSANPNAIENKGRSRNHKAIRNTEFVRLLLGHGADICLCNRTLLFSAIDGQDIPAFTTVLKSGADYNARPRPIQQIQKVSPLQRVNEHTSYPIHYDAGPKFKNSKNRSVAIRIIELLLGYEADPSLEFSEEERNPTILYDILACGGIIQPFLALQNLEIERRDVLGRKLSLAAFLSTVGTATPSSFNLRDPRGPYRPQGVAKKPLKETIGGISSSRPIYFLGGDLKAIENEGCNALHLLLRLKPLIRRNFKRTYYPLKNNRRLSL
jgi:hypothetical protein